jgi:hypothetical protein
MAVPPIERLAQLLGMLGSHHDGEVLNAAKAAHRLFAQLQTTWLALLAATPEQLEEAYDIGYRAGVLAGAHSMRPRSWREVCRQALDDHERELSEWEITFCSDYLQRGWPNPTPRQEAVLRRIADKCDIPVPD